MEILAPGGSPEAANAAIEAGADAIYIGLNDFSARKGASNFDFPQLQTLKRRAEAENIKIYAALNTIIKDDELTKAGSALLHLRDIGIDAIILQDYGLAEMCRELIPEIPIHASTQMAVHNPEGAGQLRKIGFSRVILARELTIREIKTIRKENPGLELEVFIHGALCYSMSGLCLASGLMLNRSGNRGECGQICRTWFSYEDINRYFFSCRDLESRKSLPELKEMGIRSVKIEGRMKSPEYVKAAVSYYRQLSEGIYSKESEQTLKQIFSRRQTPGWLQGKKSPKLDTQYPGHYGREAAKIKSVQSNKIVLDETIKLRPRDGILYFREGNPPTAINRSFPFPDKNNGSIKLDPPPQKDSLLYRTSRHDGNEKSKTIKNDPQTISLTGKIIQTEHGLSAELDYYGIKLRSQFSFDYQQANSPQNLKKKITNLFHQNKDSLFQIEDLKFIADENHSWDDRFFPLSLIKKMKNDLYKQIDNSHNEIRDKYVNHYLSRTSNLPTINKLPERSRIKGNDDLPFLVDFKTITPNKLYDYKGIKVFALSPLAFNYKQYQTTLIDFLKKEKKLKWLIGLNNPAHLELPKILRAEKIDAAFFIDYALYSANRKSLVFFHRYLNKLEGVYPWLENPDSSINPSHDPGFNPPLFISRNCFYKESLENACPPDCPKQYKFNIEQNNKKYTVLVKDCITYLLK